MRLSIRHTTRYKYSEPVVHALLRLRLTPKHTQGQEIIDWQMEYENAHEELAYEDQHFNTVTLVSVLPGTSEVVVTCKGLVDTEDHAGVIGRHSGHMPLWSFLGQTPLTRPGPVVRAILREAERDGESKLDQLHALSTLILERVAYKVGSTRIDTTGEEAAEAGYGVCQDHTHIFVGAARLLDVPARYVSGYLMMNDRIDQEATHAWAEAYVEGLGWVGFDVSNGISPDARYIRVATGRDYRDATPLSGIAFGAATQELQVDVSVEQQEQIQQ